MEDVAAWRRWSPVLLWAALILWLGTRPAWDFPAVRLPAIDKIVHAALYLVLGWLLRQAWPRAVSGGWLAVFCCTLLGTAHGALLEWAQASIPGRSAELGDLAADALGAALGAGSRARTVARRRSHG